MRYFIIIICLFFSTSCLTTLQPLVTSETIISNDRIVGAWQYDKGIINIRKTEKNDEPILNKPLMPKIYYVDWERAGVTYFMAGALTTIAGQQFIELFPLKAADPQRPDGSGYEVNPSFLPCYTVARLRLSGDNSMHVAFLDGEYLKQQIIDGNMRIKHEYDKLFGNFLITASSAELQQFFGKYGNNDKLYSSKNSITLNRKG